MAAKKSTKVEKAKYDGYVKDLEIFNLKPLTLTAWVARYREAQKAVSDALTAQMARKKASHAKSKA